MPLRYSFAIMPRFPKTARIGKAKEMTALLQDGKSYGNSYFGLRWRPGSLRRLGIVVSKKMGRPVQKNRLKRIIREVFRLNAKQFPLGDVMVIARSGLVGLTNGRIRQELLTLLKD